MAPRISIIIPVLNEAAIIPEALEALMSQRGAFEVIVADGGSSDGSREVAGRYGARVIDHPAGAQPGIGEQINQGAAHASGETLLFLHADVRLPEDAMTLIESALTPLEIVGGGFIPRFGRPQAGRPSLALSSVERVWQNRTRHRTWFAGDTAPFVRRAAFRAGGGYPTTLFASDWDWAARMRRLGRLAVIEAPVLVDPRRHLGNGVIKTLIVTGSIELMYRLGVSRTFLRAWYRRWLPRERQPAISPRATPYRTEA